MADRHCQMKMNGRLARGRRRQNNGRSAKVFLVAVDVPMCCHTSRNYPHLTTCRPAAVDRLPRIYGNHAAL